VGPYAQTGGVLKNIKRIEKTTHLPVGKNVEIREDIKHVDFSPSHRKKEKNINEPN